MNKFFIQNRNLLKKEISKVIKSRKNSLLNEYPWSNDALTRLEKFTLNGKMIRGLLVVLAAGSKNKAVRNDAVKIGVAIELMHAGLLIHDDIMDRDVLRRGKPSIYMQYQALSKITDQKEALHYGESMASCVAIISYYLGMGELGKLQNKQHLNDLINLFGFEMSLLGLGQMDDVHTALSKTVDEESCLRVYQQKTGRYTFGLPMTAGIIASAKSSKFPLAKLNSLGNSLGIIFQLRDDFLGVFSSSDKTGKSVGGDIREKKKTWIYFKFLQVASKVDKRKVESLYNQDKQLSKSEQKLVLDLMNKYDMQTVVNKELSRRRLTSLKALDKLPFEKEQRIIFDDLINYLVVREK